MMRLGRVGPETMNHMRRRHGVAMLYWACPVFAGIERSGKAILALVKISARSRYASLQNRTDTLCDTLNSNNKKKTGGSNS